MLSFKVLHINWCKLSATAVFPCSVHLLRGGKLYNFCFPPTGPVSNVMVTASSTDLVEFNSSVSLSCSASGCPLTFLWLDGSTEVTASDRLQLTDGGATLTIVKVTRDDQERFRCHVSNPIKNGTSDPVNLSMSCELLTTFSLLYLTTAENIRESLNYCHNFVRTDLDFLFVCLLVCFVIFYSTGQ